MERREGRLTIAAWARWPRLALGLLLLAGLAHGQRLIEVTGGFKFVETYGPPHETQTKWLLEGTKIVPLTEGRYLMTEPKLQTFSEAGEREMIIEAPQATLDQNEHTISSPGSLRVQTADGKFSIEGEGFLWQQTNSALSISNQVHTVVHPELLQPPPAPARTQPEAPLGPGLKVFADRFNYQTNAGIYTGHVRVAGTNLAGASGILTVQTPMQQRQLQSLTLEQEVTLDYRTAEGEAIHATGQRVIYTTDTDVIQVSGNPTWHSERREGRGDELFIDRTNKIVRATGHAYLKMRSEGLGAAGLLPGPEPPAADSGAATNRFVEITSENYELRTNRAVFREEVRVRELVGEQERGELNCSQMTLTYAGTNELQTMLAENHIVIKQTDAQGEKQFTAGQAVYTATNGLLELTQEPAWRAGSRQGKGDRILVTRDEMVVSGNASMRLPAEEMGQPMTSAAGAPEPAKPRAATNEFATIFCREYRVTPEKTALFSGGVRIEHPQMNWTCQKITLPPASGTTARLVAEQTVAFDLMDEKGQKVHGTGDTAVYTRVIAGAVTNAQVELTGNPAMLSATNGTFRNKVITYDAAHNKIWAVGNYLITGTAGAVETNLFQLPKKKSKKR